MNTLRASVSFLLDTRRQKSNKTYPVKLTLYFNGQKERINTTYEFTQEDWDKMHGEKLRDDNLKQSKRKLAALLAQAQAAIDKLDEFSFAEFKEIFLNKHTKAKETTFFDLFEEYIMQMEKEERFGNASAYKTAKNSLKHFQPSLAWKTFTRTTLEDFESYLRADKKSPSTIGIYMRHVRAIVNLGIKKGYMQREKYPFTDYVIPASRNIKKALSNEDLKRLLAYETNNTERKKYYDFWILSYLCNGMNIADICRLKQENYSPDLIYFFRAKTIRTKKKDLRPIKVYLNDRAKEIIIRYKTDFNSKDEYLFPILQKGINEKTIKNRIHDFIRRLNEQLKGIGCELSILTPLRSYEARHTFSTVLKRKGIDSMYIKEALGHSSLIVTENYLDDFEDDVKKQYSNILTKLD